MCRLALFKEIDKCAGPQIRVYRLEFSEKLIRCAAQLLKTPEYPMKSFLIKNMNKVDKRLSKCI